MTVSLFSIRKRLKRTKLRVISVVKLTVLSARRKVMGHPNARTSRSMRGLDLDSQIYIGVPSALARSKKMGVVLRCHALFVNTDGAGCVAKSWIRVTTTNSNLSVRF